LRKMKVLPAGLLAIVLAFFLSANAAMGAPGLTVKVNNGDVARGSTKLVNDNTVIVSVYDNNGETGQVLVNNKKATSVTGEVYTWRINYPLTLGKNDVDIAARWSGGTESFKFAIMYVNLPVPGLSYSVPSLPAAGKIEVFNKSLTLTYPKNNILVDQDGKVWGVGSGEDTSITFEIVTPPPDLEDRRPDDFHYLASPDVPFVFHIEADPGAKMLQPGRLTLTYDQNISSTMADQLAIWYSPDNDWNGPDNQVLGGYTNPARRAVTAPFQFSEDGGGYYAVFLSQREFNEFQSADGNAVKWSYSNVMPLWARGIAEANDQSVSGNIYKTVSDNWFGLINDDGSPKEITRLEFTTMMVKGLGLPLVEKPSDGEEIFSDVKYNDGPKDNAYFGPSYSTAVNYYKPSIVQYIETAVQNGIIAGYPDRTFAPAAGLKRQEAAVILARTANLKLSNDDQKVRQDLDKIFEDADSIPLWAAPSVLEAQKAKLIVGEPGSDPKSKKLRFNPSGKLSRAEGITFAYRLLKKLKKI